MIVKGDGDEPKNLDRCLNSVAPYVDAIYITLTGEKETLEAAEAVCKKHNVIVSYGTFRKKVDKEVVEWSNNFIGEGITLKEGQELFMFDEARNFNLEQVPEEYEWIFWLDCDDILNDGKNLKVLAERGIEQGIESFFCEYLYQVETDEQGRISGVIIKHLRERLIRNIGVYKWVAPIHETLIEQRPTRKSDTQDISVIHLATHEDRVKSIYRNLANLEYLIFSTQGKDPRPIYYLAKAYFDLNTEDYDEKAKKLIALYLHGENPSGWTEERAQANEYLSEIYRRHGKIDEAIASCMNGLIECPDIKQLYLQLAINYMYKNDYEKALFWLRLGESFPTRKTTLVENPREAEARKLEVMYNVSINTGKIDEANAAAEKLKKILPDNPNTENALNLARGLKIERDITKTVVELSNILKQTGERSKIKALLDAVPQLATNNPFIQQLIQDNVPPKYRDEKDVVIYCGPGFTNWSPKGLLNPGETFVGGSEEAVIRMSKELAAQGWNVTVYADPGDDEGEHDGVLYLPYYKFNRKDTFNILISWRDIRFFDSEFKAKLTYLWNHDIQNPLEYTKERLERITKVFFLSKWHRDNVPTLEDKQVFLTSNGI